MPTAWLLLALASIAIAARAPNLLAAPRFWAEEGSAFFREAHDGGVLAGLTFVYHRAGYFAGFTNLATTLSAHVVPLERAPLVTTWLAFLAQLAPIAIVVFGRSPLSSSLPRTIAAVAILVFAPTIIGEVWLTSLHAAMFLAAAATLILIEDTEGLAAGKRWAYRAVLLMGSLSGAYVVYQAPVFALRAWTERSRERVVQLAVLCGGVAVQAAVFAHGSLAGVRNEKRFFEASWSTLEMASTAQIGTPLLGRSLAEALAHRLGPVFLLGWLALLAIAFAARRRLGVHLNDSRVCLALAFSALLVGTSLTAFDGRPGGRYAVVPGIVLLLLVLDCARPRRYGIVGWLAIAVLAVSLRSGATTYRAQKHFACDGATSDWRGEVARWRIDPDRPLRICPESWRLELDPPD